MVEVYQHMGELEVYQHMDELEVYQHVGERNTSKAAKLFGFFVCMILAIYRYPPSWEFSFGASFKSLTLH